MKKIFASLALLGVASCTGPVNDETVRDMPTGFLCKIVSNAYIALPSEERAIYKELERRGERCEAVTQRVIIQKDY